MGSEGRRHEFKFWTHPWLRALGKTSAVFPHFGNVGGGTEGSPSFLTELQRRASENDDIEARASSILK